MNLIAGATGFLGNYILIELGNIESQNIAISRRVIPNLPNNTQELIIDFDDFKKLEIPNIDHIYLSLGYPLLYHNVMGFMSDTLKRDFYKVDFTYQLELAKKAKKAGARGISLVSAVGANSKSMNFYLKTKGILEEEIINLGFDSTNFFQPGHLRGNKFRLDIVLADFISVISDPFLHGPLKKFRSISARKLSQFIVYNSLKYNSGINYFEFKDFS